MCGPTHGDLARMRMLRLVRAIELELFLHRTASDEKLLKPLSPSAYKNAHSTHRIKYGEQSPNEHMQFYCCTHINVSFVDSEEFAGRL